MKDGQESNLQIPVMVRYGLVGLLGTVLHFTCVILLVEFAHFDPILGSALGFLLVLLVSYSLNRTWTFRSRNRGKRQFLRYLFVSSIGLGLNSAINGIIYMGKAWWWWSFQSLIIY